jgi:hypothetical protein
VTVDTSDCSLRRDVQVAGAEVIRFWDVLAMLDAAGC